MLRKGCEDVALASTLRTQILKWDFNDNKKRSESSEDAGLSGASRGTITWELPAVKMMLVCSHDRRKRPVRLEQMLHTGVGGEDEIRLCKIGNTLNIILNFNG